MGQRSFETLVGSYPCYVLQPVAGSHAGLFGHLWIYCLWAPQGEDRFRIRCCSPIVVAADCNSCPDSRAHI